MYCVAVCVCVRAVPPLLLSVNECVHACVCVCVCEVCNKQLFNGIVLQC